MYERVGYMPRKKEHKEVTYELDYCGYMLYQHMLTIHDEFRNLDQETQERLSEFVYYLGEKFQPSIEDGYDIENEKLYVTYKLSKVKGKVK